MNAIVNSIGSSPEAITQLVKYLTRSVNGQCFASSEEQEAAKLINQMLTLLKDTSTSKSQTILLQNEITSLKEELEQDKQRLKYCLENQAIYNKGHLYVGLDKEQVINEDFRTAIDNLRLTHP